MTQDIEKYVEEFWGKFAWCDLQDSVDNKRMNDWLRATLASYGNARYEEGVKAEMERVRESEEKELRSLVGALYDEFCETQLATEQQWNGAVAPKLKRLANVIRGLDPESVTARQYKFPRHLSGNN